MELNIFMRELESALVKRGIQDETAKKHVANLRRTFTSDDLSEISAIRSTTEIEELADSISLILNKNTQSIRPVPAQQPKPVPAPKPQPTVSEPEYTVRQSVPKKKKSTPVIEEDFFDYSVEPEPSTKGLIIFWVGLFFTLPITLGLLAAIFGSFAALFVGLAALIIAGIAVLIATVAVGAGVSLIGIIFGITQLFSFVAAGIYEIGLGVMVAGIVLFASILIYNFSIRLIPWVITQLGNFCGFVARKIKTLFSFIRRECYKL